MRFSSISINLQEFFIIISFVWSQISQSKLNQFYHVGGVLESSGQADFKTVPGFAFRAKFEGDIEGFTLLKVLLATTVWNEISTSISPTDVMWVELKVESILALFRNICHPEYQQN